MERYEKTKYLIFWTIPFFSKIETQPTTLPRLFVARYLAKK